MERQIMFFDLHTSANFIILNSNYTGRLRDRHAPLTFDHLRYLPVSA